MRPLLPPTPDRVPRQTADEVNRRIHEASCGSVLQAARTGRIDARLRELDHEWDIERTLEANASVAALIGLGLGAFVHRRFYLLSAIVAGFLLQHATQGWCPPLPVFRRLGVRTAREIDQERSALKALRGDFQGLPEASDQLTAAQSAQALRAAAR
jgi:hypothetical protein